MDGSAGGRSASPLVSSSPPKPALVGTWEVAARPDSRLTLNADGAWTGFDGCSRLRGNWLVLDEGLFAASATQPERSGCSAVALGEMLTAATRAEVTGGRLVLSDAGAGRAWELTRAPASRSSNRSTTVPNVR